MMEQELVTRVLTFNFDLILEKALALLGLRFPAYYFCRSTYKENLRPLPSNTIYKQTAIVFGYNVEADRAFNLIEKEFNSQNVLVWLSFSETQTNHLNRFLKKSMSSILATVILTKQ